MQLAHLLIGRAEAPHPALAGAGEGLGLGAEELGLAGYQTYDQTVETSAGEVMKLKLKLLPGG